MAVGVIVGVVGEAEIGIVMHHKCSDESQGTTREA